MSTDIEPRKPALPNVGALMRELHAEAVAVEESGVNFGLQVMDAILGAETVEDMWRAQEAGTVSGKDFAGRPFIMYADRIEWRRSRQAYIDQGGFPFYFVAKVADMEDGREVAVNCGGQTIVAMVRKLASFGLLDGEGMPLVIRANPADSGNEFLTIHPAPVLTRPNAKGK